MNDSILFLALTTIFGVAMLIVGWAIRDELAHQDAAQMVALVARGAFRDNPNPQDSAGA